MKKIILASKSPRRKEILSACGFDFEICTAETDESIDEKKPSAMVEQLSARKAMAVWDKLVAEKGIEFVKNILVLGSDTVVSFQDAILGKPADRTDAVRMVTELQGQTHQVYTGVTLVWMEDNQVQKETFFDQTDVTFYPMSTQEVETYVATGECDDKAGAYAVQGYGMKYIEKLNGDYHNVVGLPAAKLYQNMKKHKLI